MVAYMFQFELPSTFTDEIAATIPQQRAHINRLFLEGRLLSYSVSQLRTALWCVIAAENEQEAMEVVAGFPLHPYFTDVMCHPLLFHNTVPTSLPDISLN
jgi:hypothetical protein